MNAQDIIVALAFLSALVILSKRLIKSFSKKSCASTCVSCKLSPIKVINQKS